MPDSLRGHLLIAAPSLFDYFRRTVVLVIEHTPEGAMGVVLGRETETRVADAVPALAELPGADDVVYRGGPVSPESVVALGDFGQPEEAGLRVVGSLGTLDPDRLRLPEGELRDELGAIFPSLRTERTPLTGVHDERQELRRALLHRGHDRRHLHEVGTRPDDVNDFQHNFWATDFADKHGLDQCSSVKSVA